MDEPLSSLPALPARRARRGSELRRRYDILSVRLLPEQRAQLEADAERAGLSPSGYVRVRLFATPSPIRAARRAPVNAQLLAQTLAQLGKVGGNLHQLVKYLNFGNADVLRDAKAVLAELRAVAASIMAALGRPPRDY